VRIKIVLVGGLVLTAIAALAVLQHAPLTVAATNGVVPEIALSSPSEDVSACQRNEALPRGTSAIRLGLEATTGPRVAVTVLAGSRVLTSGTQGTSWFGSEVTIPVRPVDRALSHVTVCFHISLLTGIVTLGGVRTDPSLAATVDGRTLPGRFRIVYLRPSGRSWWSLAGLVIQHMGLGRAASGSWIAIPIAALMVVAIALGSLLVVRELE
jgi:hypothetical protein